MKTVRQSAKPSLLKCRVDKNIQKPADIDAQTSQVFQLKVDIKRLVATTDRIIHDADVGPDSRSPGRYCSKSFHDDQNLEKFKSLKGEAIKCYEKTEKLSVKSYLITSRGL